MHRFYLPPGECKTDSLALTGREARHALQVLRLRPGDTVVVLDGAGGEFACEITTCDRSAVSLRVKERNFVTPPPCHLTLLQALPKGKIIEDIIQKATELGVRRVVPLLTERVTTHLDAASSAAKTEKWRLVAIEAIKQCGAAWLPEIAAPLTPREFLARGETFELPLVASLQPGSRPAREYFERFRREHRRQPASVCVWIGPEGDLTAEEVRAIQAGGALPITLGRLVLRVETAAIYCLAIVNHELQDAPSS